MKFSNPLIVVSDMEKSKLFYYTVLGLDVILDFGANNNELYFEEDDFDNFLLKLNQFSDICYIHPVIEHSWSQRDVRFYDIDKHIIEVGENINKVVRSFLNRGMSVENVALKMDIPVDYVKSCL